VEALRQDFLEAFLNSRSRPPPDPDGQGFWQTLLLSLMVVPLGIAAASILAMLSTRVIRWMRWPLMAWVDVFRALPPLVLLIFLYAGLPFAGLDLSAWGAVAVAFLLNTGAYYGEILRAGIESVPRGPAAEAARALGPDALADHDPSSCCRRRCATCCPT
jgi:polar amino acid transport system permease protein